MNILVTGGAGYIGAVTARQLQQAGHTVIVYDNLSHGYRERVEGLDLVIGDTTDYSLVKQTLEQYHINAVIHFAAWIEVGESMKDPGKYFYNNVFGSLQLFRGMADAGVNKLVFSSTAGVYGNPEHIPIAETDQKIPLSPYGESKLTVEKMLYWFDRIHNLKSIIIRYFNAAGALPNGTLGEAHEPESHLIPNVIKAALNGQEFKLFGDDYDTPDGTCIRDYIHVLDLASAHIMAIEALAHGHPSDIYNAGTGNGYSNKEVVLMVEKVTGHHVNLTVQPRRPGDPARLIADASKMKNELGWKPEYSDLENIIQTAWLWHKSGK